MYTQTPRYKKSDLVRVWQGALASEIGVVVLVDDPFRAKQALYSMRDELDDPALRELRIMGMEPDDERICIVRRRRDAET
jgi:hypothetical protein